MIKRKHLTLFVTLLILTLFVGLPLFAQDGDGVYYPPDYDDSSVLGPDILLNNYYYSQLSLETVKAENGDNSIIITWDSKGEYQYNVYRKSDYSDTFSKITPQTISEKRYEDKMLPADETYQYYVTKIDENGKEEKIGTVITAKTNESVPTKLDLTFSIKESEDGNMELIVNVLDQNGNPIEGLTEMNFEVKKDGTTKTVLNVTTVKDMIQSGSITMDYSGSMGDNDILRMEILVKELIEQQKKEEDKYEIIKFSSGVSTYSKFTEDKDVLIEAVNKAHERGGSTAFYDAVYQGIIDSIEEDNSLRKYVIGFTDGMDNVSIHDLYEIINLARQYNIPIFTVAYGSGADLSNLKLLAQETGGTMVTGNYHSSGLYELLSKQIQSSYALTIDSEADTDGSVISVKCEYEDLEVTKELNIGLKVEPYYQPLVDYVNNNLLSTMSTESDEFKVVKHLYTNENEVFTSKDDRFLIATSPYDKEVDNSTYLIVVFNKETIKDSVVDNIIVKNKKTDEIIEGTIKKITNNIYVFKPTIQFFAKDESDVVYNSLKPNYEYEVTVKGGDEGVKSFKNKTLADDGYKWTFKTKELDYGLYWFGGENTSEKYVPGRPNPYYSDNKKTLIYIHGWQPDTVENDYERESFIFHDKDYEVDNIDISSKWLNNEWNVGIYYWNQFADEGMSWDSLTGVTNAEYKIWDADYDKEMRYRIIDDDGDTEYSKKHAPNKSVSELFYDTYLSALKDNVSGNIRIVGHSLGHQVAVNVTKKLKDTYITDKESVENIMPNRLALLDPFWTTGGKGYLGKSTTNSKATETFITALNVLDIYFSEDPSYVKIVGYLQELTNYFKLYIDADSELYKDVEYVQEQLNLLKNALNEDDIETKVANTLQSLLSTTQIGSDPDSHTSKSAEALKIGIEVVKIYLSSDPSSVKYLSYIQQLLDLSNLYLDDGLIKGWLIDFRESLEIAKTSINPDESTSSKGVKIAKYITKLLKTYLDNKTTSDEITIYTYELIGFYDTQLPELEFAIEHYSTSSLLGWDITGDNDGDMDVAQLTCYVETDYNFVTLPTTKHRLAHRLYFWSYKNNPPHSFSLQPSSTYPEDIINHFGETPSASTPNSRIKELMNYYSLYGKKITFKQANGEDIEGVDADGNPFDGSLYPGFGVDGRETPDTNDDLYLIEEL